MRWMLPVACACSVLVSLNCGGAAGRAPAVAPPIATSPAAPPASGGEPPPTPAMVLTAIAFARGCFSTQLAEIQALSSPQLVWATDTDSVVTQRGVCLPMEQCLHNSGHPCTRFDVADARMGAGVPHCEDATAADTIDGRGRRCYLYIDIAVRPIGSSEAVADATICVGVQEFGDDRRVRVTSNQPTQVRPTTCFD